MSSRPEDGRSEVGRSEAAYREAAYREVAVRIALVADDLTSASDGAAPFQAAGFPARITIDCDGPDGEAPYGVTAVDLDTRAATEAVATGRVLRAVRALAGADALVKTVDSTLRGHLAAEIGAALEASGRTTAVIAPAFPAEGRTTVGGIQHLGGRPVHDTAFARDPSHPVRCADVAELVPGAVRAGTAHPGELARLVGTTRFVVADAASDDDLDAIVAAVPEPGRVLWVGSPGLAAALARRLSLGRATATPDCADAGETAGAVNAGVRGRAPRVLGVVGSLHPASREQAARLAEVFTGALVPVTHTSAVDLAEQRLAGPGTAVLAGPTARTAGGDESAGYVPGALAEAVATLAARRAFDALVLTGGETARAVLLGLGARRVDLAGEPQPGIALGLLDRPPGLPVVLKAGGFGDRDTLVRLVGHLAGTGSEGATGAP